MKAMTVGTYKQIARMSDEQDVQKPVPEVAEQPAAAEAAEDEDFELILKSRKKKKVVPKKGVSFGQQRSQETLTF